MFMKLKILKFLILLFSFNIFLSISQSNEDVPLNNIAINEIPKSISSVLFEDFSGNEINLNNYISIIDLNKHPINDDNYIKYCNASIKKNSLSLIFGQPGAPHAKEKCLL